MLCSAQVPAAPPKNPNPATGATTTPKKDTTTIWNNITFLNAANFNFTEDLGGSYLGKLNIFAPDIKDTPFGFNAGIMRIRLNYDDTTNSPLYTERKLINPLDLPTSISDQPLEGTKYLRQLNQYNSNRSNTVWSFYVQPLFRIVSWAWPKEINAKDNSKTFRKNSMAPNGIFFHLHGELLVNKTSILTKIRTIQQDTQVVGTPIPGESRPDPRPTYVGYRPNPIAFNQSYLNGYFGAGLTFNLDPFGNGNSRFFFQPTFGFTTNSANWASQDISSSDVRPIFLRTGNILYFDAAQTRESRDPKEWGKFYLIRTMFSQKLSSNAQIVIGSDIRGLWPKDLKPIYATYVGVNINLDALAKIISDNGNTE